MTEASDTEVHDLHFTEPNDCLDHFGASTEGVCIEECIRQFWVDKARCAHDTSPYIVVAERIRIVESEEPRAVANHEDVPGVVKDVVRNAK